MKTVLFALVALCLIGNATIAQPTTDWSNVYSLHERRPNSLIPVSDGGFVLGGTHWLSESFGAFCLIRTDADGDTLWTRDYIGSHNRVCGSATGTLDGGYVFGGEEMMSYYNYDAVITKVDSEGDVEWTRSYGSSQQDEMINGIIQTSDSGYVISGCHGQPLTCDTLCLTKFDANGDSLWTVSPIPLYPTDLVQASNGDILVTGGSGLIRCSSDGTIESVLTYDPFPGVSESIYSIATTTDGGFILVGTVGSLPQRQLLLIRANEDGDTLWARRFGQNCGGHHVRQTSDLDFIVTLSGYANHGYLMKVSGEGDSLWTYDLEHDECQTLQVHEAAPGTFIVGGTLYQNYLRPYLVQITSPLQFDTPHLAVFRPGIEDQMRLFWGPVMTAGTYYIWASGTCGGALTLLDSTTETTYTDDSLYSKRYYQVQAHWADVTSDLSNIAGYLKKTAGGESGQTVNTPFGLPFVFWHVPVDDQPEYGTESHKPSSIIRSQTSCGTISTADRISLQGGSYAYRSSINACGWAGTLETNSDMIASRAYYYVNKSGENFEFVLAGDADTTGSGIPSVGIGSPNEPGASYSVSYSWRDPRDVSRDRLNLLTSGFTGGTIATSDRVTEQGGSYFYYRTSDNTWQGQVENIAPGKAYYIVNKQVDHTWTYTYDAGGQP